MSGGWQVWPGQVTAFSNAVAQVRDDLNTVFSQVDQLTSPAYQTQLGNSPVGEGLATKFLDRLSGDGGLLDQLNTVLAHLEQFVSAAEQTASQYAQADATTAQQLGTAATGGTATSTTATSTTATPTTAAPTTAAPTTAAPTTAAPTTAAPTTTGSATA